MATYTTNLNLKKPAQSDKIRIADINNNMDDIDAAFGPIGNDSVATQIGNIQGALAIVAVGDSHAAVTAGQFVYVRSHETLDAGLYVASANIAENGALSLSNLTADSSGGLNALNSNITGEYESLDTHVFIYRQGKQRTIIFKYAPNSEISGITLATKDRPAFWQWCFGLSTDGSNHYPVMAFVELSANGGLIFQVFTGGYNADSGNTAPGASRLFHGALTYYVE